MFVLGFVTILCVLSSLAIILLGGARCFTFIVLLPSRG